jgi:hypothetical protein
LEISRNFLSDLSFFPKAGHVLLWNGLIGLGFLPQGSWVHGSTDCALVGHAIWLGWFATPNLIVFEYGQLATPSKTVRRARMGGDSMSGHVQLSDLKALEVGSGALELCAPLPSERGTPNIECT